MKKETIILTDFLTEIFPTWATEIPDLAGYFHEYFLEPGELLNTERGDIYLVSEGAFGKYTRREPLRYILPGELIIIGLRRRYHTFKALNFSRVYMLDRPSLYRISCEYPNTMTLYDELLQRQQDSLEFRQQILLMPKAHRYAYFKSCYATIVPLIDRKELAVFLQISPELLRRVF